MRVNTLRYFPDARYTDLATNTTLGTATRHDTPSKTLTIEETTGRTFKSVRLRVHFQDRFTVANEITGIRMGVKLGAAAAADTDRSFTLANTSDHCREMWDLDVTSYFQTNFGAATTQTFIASLAVSTTIASNIGGTIWFELIITYEYDNTAGSKRTRTVPVVMQSHYTYLTSGSMVEFGSSGGGGATNAPANQIPAFDTYLEEAGKTYLDMGLVMKANTGSVASDTTPSIQIDAAGAVSLGLIGQALQTTRMWMGLYNYPFGTYATNTDHSVKAQTDQVNTMNGFGAIMWVTYSYTIAGTTRVTCVAMLALEEQGGLDGKGPVRGVSPSDGVAGDAMVYEVVADIQEPGTITLKQSGVYLLVEGVIGGGPVYRCGSQGYRSGIGGTGISSHQIMRGDHSAGAWTLTRGINRLLFSCYNTLQNRITLGGFAFVVYSADVPAAGPDAATRILHFINAAQNTTPALNTIIATAGQNTPVLYTPWKMTAALMEIVGRGNSNGCAGLQQLMSEVNAGEFSDAGWVFSPYQNATAQAELSTLETFHIMTHVFHTTDQQANDRMVITAARRHTIVFPVTQGIGSLSTWLTIANTSYTVSGVLKIDGAAAPNGRTLKVWAVDADNNVEFITSTVTAGGAGAFSATVPGDTRTYFVTHHNGADNGASIAGTPGAAFDVIVRGSSLEVTSFPAVQTTSTGASFDYTSTSPVEYSVDGGGYTPSASSPIVLAGLSVAAHTITIRVAADTAQKQTFSWSVVSGGGGGDVVPPTITIISPTPGSIIGAGTPIVFRYSDETGLRRPMPMVKFLQPDDGTGIPKYKYELIHDGDNFTPDFTGVKIVITPNQVYEYSVTRKGGWNKTLEYAGGSPTLVPFGTDTGGNEPV